MRTVRMAAITVRALAGRPDLWVTTARQLKRFAPDGWWKRLPFLPIPEREVLEFRATTQYGDPQAEVSAEDLVAWLEWCRAEQKRSA